MIVAVLLQDTGYPVGNVARFKEALELYEALVSLAAWATKDEPEDSAFLRSALATFKEC